MRRGPILGLTAILLASCASDSPPPPAQTQTPFVYPAQGQTPELQAQDEFECFKWAQDQTGFDPAAPVDAPQSDGGRSVGGSAATGAGFGAAGGALVGALFGSPLRGAAIGAASGALLGGGKASGRQQEQRRAENQAEQQQTALREEYFRAFRTCMTGRGFTVT